ncbi:MAG: PIG-L family deacetylase [Candidatus Bathyarchaeota archaeon]|nr:MAG: PIG-L family deacetylase [Candidatus Bathyarchaeota archaeon]
MLFDKKKILIVGAHPDDLEYGCGGTVAKYGQNNDIRSLIFAPCLEDPQNAGILQEYLNAMQILGVRKIMKRNLPRDTLEDHSQEIRNALHDLKVKFNPRVVFCHSLSDIHQDHRAIADCCLTLFRDTATLLAYEITRSTRNFAPTLYVALSKEDMEKKLKALHCYKTQYRRTYFKSTIFKALARVRGTPINTTYAEAFEIMRMIDR